MVGRAIVTTPFTIAAPSSSRCADVIVGCSGWHGRIGPKQDARRIAVADALQGIGALHSVAYGHQRIIDALVELRPFQLQCVLDPPPLDHHQADERESDRDRENGNGTLVQRGREGVESTPPPSTGYRLTFFNGRWRMLNSAGLGQRPLSPCQYHTR